VDNHAQAAEYINTFVNDTKAFLVDIFFFMLYKKNILLLILKIHYSFGSGN
jgi:hypothetical protein